VGAGWALVAEGVGAAAAVALVGAGVGVEQPGQVGALPGPVCAGTGDQGADLGQEPAGLVGDPPAGPAAVEGVGDGHGWPPVAQAVQQSGWTGP
jgi:hypothetical protein